MMCLMLPGAMLVCADKLRVWMPANLDASGLGTS